MIKLNENYNKLPGNYLFTEIGRQVNAYQQANPDKKVIRLGIGDVTKPLSGKIISSLKETVIDLEKNVHGYGPEQGYDFLRNKIAENDFRSKGVNIADDEVFISTGAKEDTANFQELFSSDIKIAVPDPVYPVYVDSNVMAGRGGVYKDGRYTDFVYLAQDTRNLYGAEAAYRVAQYHYDNNDVPKAEAAANEFIEKGTPHAYWLARNFILLSDIYIAKNDAYMARQYLVQLRNNYPGGNDDIVELIDKRLELLTNDAK